MCFQQKMPKPPAPTPEEVAREEEQEQLVEAQKAESTAKLAEEKEKRTQGTIAKMTGGYGMRSLISGPRGGAGFLS